MYNSSWESPRTQDKMYDVAHNISIIMSTLCVDQKLDVLVHAQLDLTAPLNKPHS